jgi:hypothetical protein
LEELLVSRARIVVILADSLGENLVGGLDSDTRLGNGLANVDGITRAGAVTT